MKGEAPFNAFVVYRGAAPTLRFISTDGVDRSGHAVRFTARRTANAADPPALNIAVTGGAAHVDVPLTKTETLTLDVCTYVCSLEIVDVGQEDVIATPFVAVCGTLSNTVNWNIGRTNNLPLLAVA